MKKIITLLFATLFATAIYAAEITYRVASYNADTEMQTPTISCWRLGAKSPLVHRHISSTTTVPQLATATTKFHAANNSCSISAV